MRDAVIVDAVRTPVGKRDGALSSMHPVDLSSHVLTALSERNSLDPASVEDVIWGCVTQVGEQSSNVGRLAALAAGWPDTVPGTTIDRACGSSQQATSFAAAGVIAGQYDTVIAGGVESMSRVPLHTARKVGPGRPRGPRVESRYPDATFDQGHSAEEVARRWGLSRERLDEYSLISHQRAAEATDGGRFADEIVPVTVVGEDGGERLVEVDEGIRRGGTMEQMAGLKTPFADDGVVTAGNASQISDGASALLVMSGERARELGLAPMARFHSFSVVGVDPDLMLTGPIPATQLLLKRSGLALDDIGAFEINEAFASVPVAWLEDIGADPDRMNPNGGAIALGHPLGCSGTRLMTTLVHHLRANDLTYGLQSMCEAGGMANGTILERIP